MDDGEKPQRVKNVHDGGGRQDASTVVQGLAPEEGKPATGQAESKAPSLPPSLPPSLAFQGKRPARWLHSLSSAGRVRAGGAVKTTQQRAA